MKNQVILFQGDSITDVGRSRDVEANSRPNSGLGEGYAHLIASRLLANYPAEDLKFHNRGISGNRVVDLYARWKRDALNLRPNILSILIGVNDTWHEKATQNGVEVPRYEQVYRMLLQWTKEVLPETKLVLLEPFVLTFGAVDESWLEEIGQRRNIVARLSKEFNAIFLPCQEIFDNALKSAPGEHWAVDGVHPTLAGHQLLADAWIQACKELFA